MSDETLYASSNNMQVSSAPKPGSLSNNSGTQSSFSSFKDKPRPELEPVPFDKRPLWIGLGVGIGFLLLAILIGYLLYTHPAAAAVFRDIFIIYIGIGIFVLIMLLIVLLVVLTYLVLKLNDLTQLLTREVAPMLTTVQNSLNTVNGTTSFLSDNAVKPVISTVSSVAGVTAMFKALFRR